MYKIVDIKGNITEEKKPSRLDWGEAWMWCAECNCKLHSFDGYEDKWRRCPHPEQCEKERKSQNGGK